MTLAKDLMKRMMERFGGIIDLKEQPEVLDEIVDEVVARIKGGEKASPANAPGGAAPFGVSWMDSWVAHWVYSENLAAVAKRDRELATVLRGLADLKFRERLAEIRNAIQMAPPDGGPPEPGPPAPAGPAVFEPPDGGPPEPGPPAPAGPAVFPGGPFASEPGVPPVGPAGPLEPPDGGPPEPGTPPAGPSAFGTLAENPWILYWFVSLKAPALLEVIDLHLTRRIESLRGR